MGYSYERLQGGGLASKRWLGVGLFTIFAITYICYQVPASTEWDGYEVESGKENSTTGAPQQDGALHFVKLEDLLKEDHEMIRSLDPETQDIYPRYTFQSKLAQGYEGRADLYLDAHTSAPVVIKTFFATTRQNPIPESLQTHLLNNHNITATHWPEDIPSTMRAYGSPVFPDLSITSPEHENMIHALDVFYIPPTDLSAPHPPKPWKLVLPLYAQGSLEGAQVGLRMMNLTVAQIDYLYRPRFLEVIRALARMHTSTAENATGFCHTDVKMNNIFHRSDRHDMVLADYGQTRPLDHGFFKNWEDCRLVDAQRAWRTYLSLLRGASSPDDEFDAGFMVGREEWALAYWRWVTEELDTPQQMLWPGSFWLSQPELEKEREDGKVVFPIRRDGQWVQEPVTRDVALEEVESVRVEAVRWRKAVKEGEKPWWWWDVKLREANVRVDKELDCIAGTPLVGMKKIHRG